MFGLCSLGTVVMHCWGHTSRIRGGFLRIQVAWEEDLMDESSSSPAPVPGPGFVRSWC